MEQLRGLALRLTASPQTLALLGTAGEKAQLVLARSEDLTQDLIVIDQQNRGPTHAHFS